MKSQYSLKFRAIRRILECNRKYIFSFLLALALTATLGCKPPNIGGAGWDEKADIEAAKRYPTIESNRILVSSETVPYGTFKQEFQNVFQDFPYFGTPVLDSSETIKTQIKGTRYSVSYENFVLKVYQDEAVITERKLPEVFYMHPISSGAIIGKTSAEDIILCRTQSRATTGLHYIFIVDGNGEILFEKIIGAGEDWDILSDKNGEIIIGGATTKTTINLYK